MKTGMQREYEQLCRIDESPGVQGLAQLGRNAIDRVTALEAEVTRLRESLYAIVNQCQGSAVRIASAALAKAAP